MTYPPRFIRMKDAPSYLAMDKEVFTREIRPMLTEIPIGARGIAFDRLDLDAAADEYKARNGRPKVKGEKLWGGQKRAELRSMTTAIEPSTKYGEGKDSLPGLARYRRKKPNNGLPVKLRSGSNQTQIKDPIQETLHQCLQLARHST